MRLTVAGMIVSLYGLSTWCGAADTLNLPPIAEYLPNTAQAVTPPMQNTSRPLDLAMPPKGNSKSQVRRRYGHPKKAFAPVGLPAIERWVYAQFTVYFEEQYVIHSVVHPNRQVPTLKR